MAVFSKLFLQKQAVDRVWPQMDITGSLLLRAAEGSRGNKWYAANLRHAGFAESVCRDIEPFRREEVDSDSRDVDKASWTGTGAWSWSDEQNFHQQKWGHKARACSVLGMGH